jgi:thiol-disulfide isomerase/thioredoxin
MKDAILRRSEYALNALSVLGVMCILYVIGGYAWGRMAERGAIPSSPSSYQASSKSVGRYLPGVDWAKHKRTAVIALRTDCPYCQKSLPLHRKIAQLASENPDIGIIAVFSEPLMQARSALELERLPIKDVVTGDMSPLKVVGTPTVLVADSEGNLVSRFDGFLDDRRASDLLVTLDPALRNTPTRADSLSIDPAAHEGTVGSIAQGLEPFLVSAKQVAEQLRQSNDVTLLDIRSREDFAEGHLDGAINIPQEELEQRMAHEVDPSKPVLLYCTYYKKCETDYRNKGVLTSCTLALFMIKSHGFNQTALITEDIEKLKSAGLLVSTRTVDRWR